MSVTNLNKTSGVAPEKETLKEDQGPPKTLEEIITITKDIKLALWDIERYVQHPSPPSDTKNQKARAVGGGARGGGGVMKQQLEAQVMRIKGDMVHLQRMLLEEREVLKGHEGGSRGREEEEEEEDDDDDDEGMMFRLELGGEV